jgi:hypothetical protein
MICKLPVFVELRGSLPHSQTPAIWPYPEPVNFRPNIETSFLYGPLPPAFTLVSCSADSSILKMEVTCSSETSVDYQRTTWRYIPEDRILRNHGCENLRSYKAKYTGGEIRNYHVWRNIYILCMVTPTGFAWLPGSIARGQSRRVICKDIEFCEVEEKGGLKNNLTTSLLNLNSTAQIRTNAFPCFTCHMIRTVHVSFVPPPKTRSHRHHFRAAEGSARLQV